MATQPSGRSAPGTVPPLLPDAIHIWVFRLDVAHWRDWLRAGWLSTDEVDQTGRFASDEPLRRRFVICRTTLRAILGHYLGRPPAELTFAQGPHGKPYLNAVHTSGYIQFNVSHSHELALVAVSARRELGVDLERVRPVDDMDGIVARFFAPAERLAFDRLPPGDRLSTFYRYWTLKEAYLKASGVGLSRALADVDVIRGESSPLCLPDASGTPHEWRGRTLAPAAGYCGALVVEGGEGVSVITLGDWPLTALTLPGGAPTVGATASLHG